MVQRLAKLASGYASRQTYDDSIQACPLKVIAFHKQYTAGFCVKKIQ